MNHWAGNNYWLTAHIPLSVTVGWYLVCSAVCKLSIYQWFERHPVSLCILTMWASAVFSFTCLTKRRLPHQCLWQKSDTKVFLSAISYYYCHFRKSCWCYFLLSLLLLCGSLYHNTPHSGSCMFFRRWYVKLWHVSDADLESNWVIESVCVCVEKLLQPHLNEDFQVEKMKISQCCLSLTLFVAQICLQRLSGGSEPEKKAPKCGCRRCCFKVSVKSRHVLCSIHTWLSNCVSQEGGFHRKNLQ